MGGAAVKTRAEIGQERRERTRKRLLSAAAQTIAQFGERKATIDDFIQAAGVARGTFYNCFDTREDLLDALWEQVGKNPFLDIRARSRRLKDPAARLVCEARMVFERARADPTWGWLVYSLSSDDATVNEDLRTYPTSDLKAGLAANRFDFDDIASARDLVVGTVRVGMRVLLTEERSPGYEASLCKLLLRALGVKSAEASRIVALPVPQLD